MRPSALPPKTRAPTLEGRRHEGPASGREREGGRNTEIDVLRLGHRPSRDKRITTHVCLVARAFGARAVHISGMRDDSIRAAVERVTLYWGGPFRVEFEPSPLQLVRKWKEGGGKVAHLTMYGIPIRKALGRLAGSSEILVIVGGEKVPRQYYELSDCNVAIGNQPHSEVAALAIFLDRLTCGAWEDSRFSSARVKITPSERGKSVQRLVD